MKYAQKLEVLERLAPVTFHIGWPGKKHEKEVPYLHWGVEFVETKKGGARSLSSDGFFGLNILEMIDELWGKLMQCLEVYVIDDIGYNGRYYLLDVEEMCWVDVTAQRKEEAGRADRRKRPRSGETGRGGTKSAGT